MRLPRAVALVPAFLSTSLALEFFSQLKFCPDDCANLGADPKNWTAVHDIQKFNNCNQTVLFDLNIHNKIADTSEYTIRACTGSDASSVAGSATIPGNGGCGNFTAARNGSVEVAWSGNSGVKLSQDRLDKLYGIIKKQLMQDVASCQPKILFGKLGDGTILGLYAGENVDGLKSFDGLTQQLSQQALGKGNGAETIVSQYCGIGIDGASTIGLILSAKGDLISAQKGLRSLSNATCVAGLENTVRSSSTTIFTRKTEAKTLSSLQNRSARVHKSRANDCKTIQVVSGDSCGSLATKCGISGDQFLKFNPVPNLCSTLAVGQFVCCTAGTLPDMRPKPGKDGSCFQYTVQPNDFCDAIAKGHFITSQDIENFNKKTWGWQGCDSVQLGQIICLSTGKPPFPAPLSNAICGPQVAGTKAPSDTSNIAGLNPCPLNSCCDIWGQCGITPDFCTISQSKTGAPGTSAPGTAGCISNCGTDIVKGSGPSSFMKVGYWESYSAGRSCLKMSVSQIPTGYTHIHYAFASITKDFQVDTSDTPQQFQDFTKATGGFKKIVSFGGWSFSTDTGSFPIFRDGVTAANRLTFAQNVVKMIKDYNLDGVDFDWEYPGAPDIPNIPPGSPTDGPNYLDFLKTLRGILPAGKTISMAAPASYWYLKGFPIKDMAPVLDYIVFMSYDLHGQWDYQKPFAADGCPTGSCLRSHINSTETGYALAMITKAGVPTNKIVVGVSSYGRSFGVAKPGCLGPTCLFTGPDSGAIVGPCTQTAGYLADGEIKALISQGGVASYDANSDSDIVAYKDTWVAYMTVDTKTRRISKYKGLNFAGSVDWAVDLGGDLGAVDDPSDDHPTPANAPLSPSLTCTKLAAGATFTLTADCAKQIKSLGPLTNGNTPPGPSPCTETCDLLRDITGTCCGTGGSLGFPVSIIPNVELPLGLPLPPGFKLSKPLTIPGYTLQPREKSRAPIPLPAGFQAPVPIPIPGGIFPPGLPIGQPILLPQGYTPPENITVNGTLFPAGQPLPKVIPVPPDWVPPEDPKDKSHPFIIPPFWIFPGDPPFPGAVIIPPGWINPGPKPFPVPPVTYPPNSILPPGTVLPPGTILPPDAPPIVIPPGTNLPKDAPPPDEEADPDEPNHDGPALPLIADPVPKDQPDPEDQTQIPENPNGTDLVINSGCVLVDGSPRCNSNAGQISGVYQPSFHVNADQGEYSTAIVLAGFDTNQKYAAMLSPGCQLNARWPRNYGQVFVGEDNCLHDASGNIIDNQCCGKPDAAHSGSIINPWRDPRPAGSCQRTPFGVGVHFEVYIKGWVTDGGASLWKQVAGCGALTDKKFGTNQDIENDGSDAHIGMYQAEYLMHFNLPITFKLGCVGRAMVSAGAPPGDYC